MNEILEYLARIDYPLISETFVSEDLIRWENFFPIKVQVLNNLPLVLRLLSKRQNKWEIFPNFVVFSQCLNFTYIFIYNKVLDSTGNKKYNAMSHSIDCNTTFIAVFILITNEKRPNGVKVRCWHWVRFGPNSQSMLAFYFRILQSCHFGFYCGF